MNNSNKIHSSSLQSLGGRGDDNNVILSIPLLSNSKEKLSGSGIFNGPYDDEYVLVSDVWDMVEKLNANQRSELLDLLFEQSAPEAHAAAASTPFQRALSRIPALSMTLCLEMFASMVVSQSDDVLQNIILLASFLPVISAVSGNAGLQSSTQTVRGLGMGIIKDNQWGRLAWDEFLTNIFTGLWIACCVGGISFVWAEYISPTSVSSVIFGGVVSFSMFLSILMAGVIGALSPFLFRKLNIDPASSVGPLETSFQDIVGYSIFLNLARVLLLNYGGNN